MSAFRYGSNATIGDLAARLSAADHVAITAHSKPDGDSMGSCLALARVLQARGKGVDVLMMGPVATHLMALGGPTAITLVEDQPPSDEYDLIVLMDTGAWSQVEPLESWLRRHHEKVIGLDHHARGDEIAHQRVIDSSCASTTQLLVALLDELGADITGGQFGVAEALFVGLATDTGWFRHPNADAAAFAVAARLMECGVAKARLYQLVEETYPVARLMLQARALSSLTFAMDGAAAIQSLAPGDFKTTGGTVEDLTGLVNEPLCVGTVRVSVLLSQSEPGYTKLSFRSKPATPELGYDWIIDVNELAQQFNGGGHKHAAGARLAAELAEAQRRVTEALDAAPRQTAAW